MINLFFSYSHKDEELRNELETHLSALKRQGVISAWHDHRILAGDELAGRISEHLESADIILLLVSSYFIDSEYCYDIEMKRAMERHESGQARVIPVILRPCDWQGTPFGKLLVVPKDGKPVFKYTDIHEAFLEVTQAIRKVVEAIGFTAKATAPPSAKSAVVTVSVPELRSSNLRIKKSFTDRELDKFLDDAFNYVANYFEGSLAELEQRNPGVETSYKRVDANHFTAAAYVDGKAKSRCRISCGGMRSFSSGITYSMNDSAPDGSFNEQLSVSNDGYSLFLKPLGMAMRAEGPLSLEGGAEYYWEMFIEALQG